MILCSLLVRESFTKCLVLFFVDATVKLPSTSVVFQQGRDYQIACFVTGEDFVAWVTPAKPARPGVPAILSKRITEAQPSARKRINKVGDNYQLYIEKATADDGGLYQCVGASNSSTFNVSVDSKCLFQ